MAQIKTKPNAVKSSSTYDLSASRYWYFGELSLSLDTDISQSDFQALVQSGELTQVELYDIIAASAEKKTTEIGGRLKPLGAGEKRYSGNVRGEILIDISNFDYFTGKGLFSISEDDKIRGIPSGGKITPLPLSEVYGIEKEALNDGTTAKFNQIGITVDGKQAQKLDEWCLNGWCIETILTPTEETIVTGTNAAGVVTITAKDSDGNNVLNTDLGVISTNLSNYIEYSDDDGLSRVITEIDTTTGEVSISPNYGGSGTNITMIIKSALLINGQAQETLEITTI